MIWPFASSFRPELEGV